MIDQKTLDQLVANISNALPDGIKVLKADLDNNLRAVLEASLRDMNLVSREEFDVQAALLSRTIDKLKQLEQQLAEMENSR